MPWRLVSVLLACLTFLSFSFYCLVVVGGFDHAGDTWIWFKFYREGIRTPVFTGFLTVGSFLLTLKATILLRIKEIYDTVDYSADWEAFQEQRRINNKCPTAYYGPLRNLGHALLANVLLALSTAILQMTLGFVNAPWALGICLGFAATTLGLLLLLWWQIAANLGRWFNVIEKNRKECLTKMK